MMSTAYTLRLATVNDIPALVNHRRRMFEDLYADKAVVRDRAAYDAMDTPTRTSCDMRFRPDRRAWVIDDSGTIAASGALKFTDWLPRPDGQRRRVVYVHSVYTTLEYPGRDWRGASCKR